ncbi:hypothetical protein X566_19060 [Afipia sp. P52-10]|uniref:hypothetical protein n=1 Tax=Afipia sp. P52-10 TaxID=1429916 RepID=UPI0003DF3F26|nr:hypothetical protein [Afipia sp. P52-10]ETR75867.1 hypothetical protein X566_19060 [Afipia sp. P52-10]
MFAANVIDNDGSLAANSSTRLPTQAAVKSAIDALLNASNAEQFKGSIDCSANPNYPAAEAGYVYRVSVAGKIGGASGINVEVGDRLQCIVDGSASGNQATVGANWWITQANIDGAVVGPSSSVDNVLARFDGTSGKVIQGSPVVVADTTGALSRSGGGGVPVQGTNTNDNAAAGDMGEHVSASRGFGSALALTSGAAADVTSISLAPGDYEVVGAVAFLGDAATSCSVHQAGISTASATLPGTGLFAAFTNGGTIFTTGAGPAYNVGPVRISLSVTTTIYFVGQAVFSGGTMSVYGSIRARRVR